MTKCIDRVDAEWAKVKADLEVFMKDSDGNSDIGPFHEYGLSFDFVGPGTFGEDQTRGYWRYQLSTGGPGDEIRFYGELGHDGRAYLDKAEYWFLDWFDGASVNVTHEDTVQWLFQDFNDVGSLEHAWRESIED